MRILTQMSAAALALMVIVPLTSSAPANNHRNHKITICHIPPGNPANAHSITVSINALDAHLAHGDFIGSCNPAAPVPPPAPAPVIDPVIPAPPPEDPFEDWAPM